MEPLAPPAPAAPGDWAGPLPATTHARTVPATNGDVALERERPRVVEPAPVPLMDPQRVYEQWGPEAERTVVDILRSHAYVKGRHVAGFEEEFAAYVGSDHAVAVDSCTDALCLVLRAVFHDRAPDAREVILPSFTFVATAGAVVNAGGRPVFADVGLDSHNMEPAHVAGLVNERTAAVIPVHLFGAPADIEGIRAVLDAVQAAQNGSSNGSTRRRAFILEDAAQAVHAHVAGRRAGILADAATFSFYPSKNLAAAGDAGVVTTDDAEIARRVRALRDHGQTRKLYDHEEVGTNSRMDEIQAAILRQKLPHIGPWTEQRRSVAARYDQAFADAPIRPQAVLPEAESAYHLYTIRVEGRDAVAKALEAAGIHSGIYYPLPLHRQSCFADYAPSPCPNADRLAAEVLSLPCFPGLTVEEQQRVIDVVLAAVAS